MIVDDILKLKETGEVPDWVVRTEDYLEHTINWVSPDTFVEICDDLGGLQHAICLRSLSEEGYDNLIVLEHVFANEQKITEEEVRR